MEAKHTPGPWVKLSDAEVSVDGHPYLDNDDEITGWMTAGNPDEPDFAIVICDVQPRNEWDDEQMDANMRMVCAAPDLLIAAVALMDRWPTDQHEGSPLKDEADALRAAILKASPTGAA